MTRDRENLRDFPGRRWVNLGLRTVHVAGVVHLGIALATRGAPGPGAAVVLLSGLAMFIGDSYVDPHHWRDVAGAGTLLKLLLVGLMALLPAQGIALFWIVLVGSILLSHAPARLRHRRLLG